MPTYDYVCDACGHSFEKFQRFSEQPVRECPQCKQLRVRRVIHPTGIIFKGSGWYVTDHGRSSHRPTSTGNGGSTKKTSTEPAKTEGGASESSSSGGSGTSTKPAVDTDD
jgi:putative FmdB family regulatory protein